MMPRILLLSLLLLPAPSAAAADPAELFEPVRTGEELAPGWELSAIEPDDDAIAVKLDPGGLAPALTVRLTRRDENAGAFCRTRSFNIVYLSSGGEGARTPEDIHRAMQALCRLVERNDRGQIQLGRYRPPAAAPGLSWRWPGWTELILFVLLGAAGFLLMACRPAERFLSAAAEVAERRSFAVLLILLVPMAWLRLVHLDIPFEADYMTQRVFFGSLDIPDILAHRYADQRHPQLFYLVLHFFLYLGHQEWIARLPAVLCSLASAVALFILARPHLGGIRSLLCVLLLSLSTSYLAHSRDVTDIPLFVTLALLTCWLFLRCLQEPGRRRLVLLVVVETAMFYTYHLAILVAFAQLVVLLIFARSRRFLFLWVALGVALVLVIPALCGFLKLVLADMGVRQAAGQFPAHLWGQRTPAELLGQFASLAVPASGVGLLMPLLAVLGGVRWGRSSRRQPGFVLLAVLLLLSLVVLGLAVVLVRLMPYYLLFLLPVFFLFVVAGCLGRAEPKSPGPVQRVIRAAGWAVLGLLVYAQVVDLAWRAPPLMSAEGRDHFLRVGEVVSAGGGPDTVVADPDMLHTILLYYCFPRPLEMYRQCRWEGQPVNCQLGSRRFISLTAMAQMRTGWEGQALSRLQGLGEHPFWFVYTNKFENRLLLEHLHSRCRVRGKWGHLELFRCGANGE